MNRFYKMVTTRQGDNGYEILLDGRPVKTPSKSTLATNSSRIADALVLEWAAQEDKIIPDTMPLTQILTTKIDRICVERDAITQTLMKYLNTDLICYRTDFPPELHARQQQAWDPALLWFEKEFGVKLQTTTTLQALTQEKGAHEKVLAHIHAMDADRFTIMQLVSSISGSLILGLMFTSQLISADELFKTIRVEENYHAEIYNEEKYGPDPIEEKKAIAIKKDLIAAEKYLTLLL